MSQSLGDIKLPTREEPLEPQGFVHTEFPAETRFEMPRNRDGSLPKPKGGMWTSTLREEDGEVTNGWLDYCSAERWGLTDKHTLYRLEPESHLTVLEIDSFSDLQAVLQMYRRGDLPDHSGTKTTFAPLDFEALAGGFDAIRLTAEGQRDTRFSHPGLYGWDSECVLALRWIWDDIEIIRDINPEDEYRPPYDER